jgi:xanthine dehydrogenase YagS FAD-binding subunit
MRPFEYTSPTETPQVIALLEKSWGTTEVLAGGTDLIPLMKDDVLQPKRLVNIKDVGSLRGIRFNAKTGLRIGALATLQEIADNALVQKHHPALADAADHAASPQIRSLATLGGNICQRPRCWYFRGGYGLLACNDKGESLIQNGDNRFHAIFGNDGMAKFVSPSSVVPVLVAYGAQIGIDGPKGNRIVPLEKFFRIPQSEGEREHDLLPNELVTDVIVPLADGLHLGRYEIRQKAAFDWPLASAAVALHMNGDAVASARVVMGHVAPVPWLSPEAETELIGKPISEQTAEAAGKAAVANARGLGHNDYKIQLARVAVKRAILDAAGMKKAGGAL